MNETANRSAKMDTKVINFSDFVGSMDGKDDGKIKDGTSFYSASYKGQKDGQKVKKGHTSIVIDLTGLNRIIDIGLRNILKLM